MTLTQLTATCLQIKLTFAGEKAPHFGHGTEVMNINLDFRLIYMKTKLQMLESIELYKCIL